MSGDESMKAGEIRKPTDREIENAKYDVSWALREMTSNLLRVLRGAGKSNLIGEQANDLVKAYIKHQKVLGYWPSSDELSEMLFGSCLDEESRPHRGRSSRTAPAKLTITKGALQVCASRLIGQRLQELAGEAEMDEGLKQWQEASQRIPR